MCWPVYLEKSCLLVFYLFIMTLKSYVKQNSYINPQVKLFKE